MSTTPTGPAFPAGRAFVQNEGWQIEDGMTLRQYAAIQLRVPNSGTDWLDDMIRDSNRQGVATRTITTMMLDDNGDLSDPEWLATQAQRFADAFVRESKKWGSPPFKTYSPRAILTKDQMESLSIFPTRVRNCLIAQGILSLESLVKATPSRLLAGPNFGPKLLDIVCTELALFNLSLKKE